MNYALSGGHKKTLEAAQTILDIGGNAVDAAIAAYLVSFIAEPCMASIGAGGFAMVNDGNQIKVIDFFCQTPIHKKKISQQNFYPVTIDFGNTKEDFHIGKGAIATPGAIAGVYKLHQLYGSLPMRDLIEPAKIWAREGIALDRFQASDLTLLEDIITQDPEMKNVFFSSDGKLKTEGDPIRMEAYSDFLEVLSYEGRDLFYKGEVAKSIADDMTDGGHLTRADFESYEAIVRDPIQFEFMNTKVSTTGFPSVGGMLTTAILNTFQNNVVGKNLEAYSIEHFQELALIFSSISKFKNDPAQIANYLFHNFAINPDTDQKSNAKKWGGTSHFNVVDKNGISVSLTTSIGEGAGYFVPGTDMQMNNMLGEEALMPNGFHNWAENQRLQSMMCPTMIVTDSSKTRLSLGSGGAGRIPYAIAQVIINSEYFDLPIDQAIDKARIHFSNPEFEVENDFDLNTDLIPNINLWMDKTLYFGGVNAISQIGNKHIGYADSRRFGSTITSD
jgi:gamma-glutamyltranspeptidase/glutathione hydrolase